jgi:hypothetical protein
LLTGYEQNDQRNKLKLTISEQLRHLAQKLFFIQKNGCFNLKAALFVEKRKNKFAYEFKKNKFVFN